MNDDLSEIRNPPGDLGIDALWRVAADHIDDLATLASVVAIAYAAGWTPDELGTQITRRTRIAV